MRVHGDWLLTPRRLAVHLPTATAVAADLHLGYDTARRRRGHAVPLRGLDDLLRGLDGVRDRHAVRRLVIAGDLFEDATGAALAHDLLHGLEAVGLELSGVVPGNHDRGLKPGAGPLPVCPDGIRLGEWLVVHGDGDLPPGRLVLGHFHPCLRWSPTLAAPCFLVGPDRLVLPAFSPDTAGVNVLAGRRWQGYRCAALVGDDVLDFGEVARLRRARAGKR